MDPPQLHFPCVVHLQPRDVMATPQLLQIEFEKKLNSSPMWHESIFQSISGLSRDLERIWTCFLVPS